MSEAKLDVGSDFRKGDVIRFAEDHYEVLDNGGSSGTVKALDDGGVMLSGFRWRFYGEDCVMVRRATA